MIAFAVVFNRQLPIAIKGELESTVFAAMKQRFIKVGPLGDQFCIGIYKFWRITRNVNPNDVHPDVAAYFD